MPTHGASNGLAETVISVRKGECFCHDVFAHQRGRLLDELGVGRINGSCGGSTKTLHSRCAGLLAAASSVP